MRSFDVKREEGQRAEFEELSPKRCVGNNDDLTETRRELVGK